MWVSGKGKDFEPAPAGAHAGRCFGVVELGTHQTTWQGKPKERTTVRLYFELPHELMASNGKPYTISKTYTASLGGKATLRADLESWRGERFNDDTIEQGFNLAAVIGRPCLLSVIHEQGESGTYAKIAAIMPPIRGAKIPDQINPSIEFALHGPGGLLLPREQVNMKAFELLHEKTRTLIADSHEWQQIFGKNYAPPVRRPAADEAGPADDNAELDDDIPF